MSAERVIVVQMHGEPGSGKSTVARALAPHIDALVLDKDIIKSALLRVGASETLAARAAYEAYFATARSYIEQGTSIILDNPVYWESVEAHWLELSANAPCPPLLLECVCADRDELVRRLTSRNGLESQPRDPLDLKQHPGSTPTAYEPRTTLDTTRPPAEIVDEALRFIQSRLAARPIGATR